MTRRRDQSMPDSFVCAMRRASMHTDADSAELHSPSSSNLSASSNGDINPYLDKRFANELPERYELELFPRGESNPKLVVQSNTRVVLLMLASDSDTAPVDVPSRPLPPAAARLLLKL